jgi:class 3 adenylate cyclase/pimeloyl-ACP methyl ester carboxylesterase
VSARPSLSYAKLGDAHIGYQLVGDGPSDLVIFGVGTAAIESLWDLPAAVEFLEHLSTFSRVVLFDRRGIGSSDPLGTDEAFSAEGHAADAAAVLAGIRSGNIIPIGIGLGGAGALCLAAERPDITTKLVLVNATARNLVADDYAIGSDPATVAPNTNEVIWGDADRLMSVVAPSAASDPVYLEWYQQAGRLGASPAVAEALLKSILEVDVRSHLDDVAAPSLVIHSRKNRINPLSQAQYLVDRLPESQLVLMEGSDILPFVGEFHRVAEEVEEFVTGVRLGPSPTRRVAAVLFTDIVDSTATAAELGDHEWKDLMDRHDRVVNVVVRRHGGSVVKSTGDGQLATFPTPSSALRAVRELLDSVHDQLGVTLRAGVHLGEIDTRGADVTGLTVNVAARVTDLAGDGEVWVTDSMRRSTIGSDHEFVSAGTHDLKGVPDRWELCRLVG